MKQSRILMLHVLLVSALFSCANSNESNTSSTQTSFNGYPESYDEVVDDKPGFSLELSLPDFNENDSVFLCVYEGKKPYYKDTALLNSKGIAQFNSDTAIPRGLYMMLLPDKTYFELIIDTDQHFEVSTQKPRYADNMKIEGSAENQYFYQYMKASSDLSIDIRNMQRSNPNNPSIQEKQKELMKLQESFASKQPNNLFAKYVAVQKDPEIKENPPGDSLFAYRTFMDEYFINFDFNDPRLLNTPAFENRLDGFFTQLVTQVSDSVTFRADKLLEQLEDHPDYYKFTLSYLLNKYAEPKIMGMDAVYVHLAKEYYEKGKADWSNEEDKKGIIKSARLMEPLLIGNKAPNIKNLQGLNGGTVSLYDMDSEYTLLLIWDSGCGRCRARTPLFNKIQKAYADKGLEIFGATLELEPGPWKKWIAENGYNWTHGIDPNHDNVFREVYKVDAIPSMYLLDKEKRIIAKKLDPAGLAKYLDGMFGTNRAQTMDLRVPKAKE